MTVMVAVIPVFFLHNLCGALYLMRQTLGDLPRKLEDCAPTLEERKTG
jgi:hypothetical protein